MLVVLNDRRQVSYECGANKASPGRCSSPAGIKTETIDAEVWRRVRAFLADQDVIGREIERLRQDDPTTSDLATVERSLREVERQQRNLVDQLANLGGTVAALVTEKLAALDGQRGRLDQEGAEILARQTAWQAAQAWIADVRAWCEKVARNIDALTYDERRDALIALDVQVKLYRAGHSPRWEIAASLPLGAEINTPQQLVNGASSR